MGLGADIARQYLRKFPKAPTRTLARKAYTENKSLWKSPVAALNCFRSIRGVAGQKSRNDIKNTEPKAAPCAGFEKLPDGITELADWQAFLVDTPGVWAILSDQHIRYHDHKAIAAIWQEAKRRGAKGILNNGDLMDCFALSKWQKDPRQRDFRAEIESVRQYLQAERDAFPKARRIWKHGNHEERFIAYMQTKAPELLDLAEFDLGELTQCAKIGVEIVKDKRPIKLGSLWVIHGHEYRQPFTNPVNPARGLFLRARVSAICGHYHQTSQHSEKDLAEHVTSCWAAGCLCDLHPEYMPINKWNLGAAFVDVGSDGSFSVENVRVIHGKIYA